MRKVLIADDEMINRQLLLAHLTLHFEVCHLAANGLETLEAFNHSLKEQEPYDLICLDIMMPKMDGQTALEEIRKIEQKRGIGGNDMVKVLMVTALDSAKDIMAAFMKGTCDGYLTKPLFPEKLDGYLKRFSLYKKAVT